MGSEKNLQQVKINLDLKHVINNQLIELLKEFKDIFAKTYKDLRGIPLNVVQQQIELDTLIPLAHQASFSNASLKIEPLLWHRPPSYLEKLKCLNGLLNVKLLGKT